MKTILVIYFSVLCAASGQEIYQFLTSPPGSLNQDQNGVIRASSLSTHFQQVFDASLFKDQLPEGGGNLGMLSFRVDGNVGYLWRGLITGVEIDLSTTTKSSVTLSPNFADNITSEPFRLIVPTDRQDIGSGWRGDNVTPFFGPTFGLGRPFHYDPAKGNLLIDVKGLGLNLQKVDPNYIIALDGVHEAQNVAVWSVPGSDANAAQGQLVKDGLVTAFVFYSVPEPSPILLGGIGMVIIGLTRWVVGKRKESNVTN